MTGKELDPAGMKTPYPQDLISNFPPKQEGKFVNKAGFSAFAISLQGASHVKKEVPCQDYSDIRILESLGILIGGIADGVGSCPLSHWGAYIAVCEALDYVENRLKSLKRMKDDPDDNVLNEILNESFEYAVRQVEKAADASEQAVRNFQSTLTVVIYNGKYLYCCHAGDDGVVAQEVSGSVKLATKRHKGEEACSVYPLQAGKWEITKIRNPVSGFVMATDGVLDAFAFEPPENKKQVYFNRIYYPFMEKALYGLIDRRRPNAAKRIMESYKDYMNSPGYRSKVTDDLTFVAVAAGKALSKAKHPQFSMEEWDTSEKDLKRRREEALGYAGFKKKTDPERTIPEETVSESEEASEYERSEQKIYDESCRERRAYVRSTESEYASERVRKSYQQRKRNMIRPIAMGIAAAVILTAVAFHIGRKTGINETGGNKTETSAVKEISPEEISDGKNERYLDVNLKKNEDSPDGRKTTPSDAGHDMEINNK